MKKRSNQRHHEISVQTNSQRKTRYRSKILILLGILCLIIAAVMEGKIVYDDHQSQVRAAEIERVLIEEISARQDDAPQDAVDITVAHQTYCGILEIPKIKVYLPVSSEYSYEQMSSSLCRYHGSLETHNMIICGHNNRSFLGKLSEIYEGDTLYFWDCKGQKYTFEVNEVQMLGGTEVSQLIEGGTDWDLSVFTCNYSGSSRYVLRCKMQ